MDDGCRLNLSTVIAAPLAIFGAWLIHCARPDLEQLGFILVSVPLLWAMYAVTYFVLTLWAFRSPTGTQLRIIARVTAPASREARIRQTLLGVDGVSLPLTAAAIGFIAVIALMLRADLREDPLVVLAAFLLIAGSWLLMITAFAVTYLRCWASDRGLAIPGPDDERFTDFVYVAVQVATSFATSDVLTRTHGARRWVSLNSVLAFLFNTIVIALCVALSTGVIL